jgi:hypothetical protein
MKKNWDVLPARLVDKIFVTEMNFGDVSGESFDRSHLKLYI